MKTCSLTGNPSEMEQAARLNINFRLNGKYIIDEFLGEGGLAYGYKAIYVDEDRNFSEKVVIKQTKRKQFLNGYFSEDRFQMEREFRLLSQLNSPSIPEVYEMFEIENVIYLVREYREGIMLNELISSGLDREAIENVCWQLMNLFEYLQENNIVYRDLKPSNLLIDDKGNIFLLDFGTARFHIPGKKTDTIALGTPGFAAPEQYGLSQTTPAADVYSFGALLYYMLTGENPEDNPFEFGRPANLRKFFPGRKLGDFLSKCLQLDSANRYQTINEARIALFGGGIFNLPPAMRDKYNEVCCGKKMWKRFGKIEYFLRFLLVIWFVSSIMLFSFTMEGNAIVSHTVTGIKSIIVPKKTVDYPPGKESSMAQYYLNKGWKCFLEGRDVQAMSCCSLALRENPYYAPAFALKSCIYEDMGHPEKAVEEIDKAISLDPVRRDIYISIRQNIKDRSHHSATL